jgi:hypothetical protein
VATLLTILLPSPSLSVGGTAWRALRVRLVTFGAPHAGDAVLMDHIRRATRGGGIERVVAHSDPVPWLLSAKWALGLPYAHPGAARNITPLPDRLKTGLDVVSAVISGRTQVGDLLYISMLTPLSILLVKVIVVTRPAMSRRLWASMSARRWQRTTSGPPTSRSSSHRSTSAARRSGRERPC